VLKHEIALAEIALRSQWIDAARKYRDGDATCRAWRATTMDMILDRWNSIRSADR
jgi:hypothetical protein